MSFLLSTSFSTSIIGVIFIVAGVLHFVKPKVYIRIMPKYIPNHKAMIYISGVFEILGGIGFLVSPTRNFAAWVLILLLFAVFSANVHMFWVMYKKRGFTVGTWLALLRLPLQFLLMYWIYWASISS